MTSCCPWARNGVCSRHPLHSAVEPSSKRVCTAPVWLAVAAAGVPPATGAPPLINAVIYEWCLDRIDPDHPLFQISYFGQIVRADLTTEQALHARTKEHKNAAARDPKDVGLHWAIQAFGADAFTVRVLETKCLPPVEARAWANAREIALIAEHGGVMRDREPDTPIRQTFNLTRGGQGDPKAMWEGLEALSGVKWRKVQQYLQKYYDEKKHLRVPESYVTPDGFALGVMVHSIRSQHHYVKGHPERLAWLQERGWVASERDAKWKDVQDYLQEYYDGPGEKKHLRVPQSYKAPDGFAVGKVVNWIRSKHIYVKGHPERLAWLQERGWVANERDAKWEELQQYLQKYYDGPGEKKHLRVPHRYKAPDGFALGKVVHSIRSQHVYVKGHPERLAWLKERGFKMHARDPVKDAERWAALGV